jgi:nucleotide-binding universal stress UspA family protein
MKKFIAAFDGLNFCESTMEYAINLAKPCKAHLVGIFLDDFMRRSYTIAELAQYEGEDLDRYMGTMDDKDKEIRDESVEVFEKACQGAGLNYSIHRDKNVAIQELLHESIYADLLIIKGNETVTSLQENAPSRFIRELLNDVQCPVFVVPPKHHPIDKVIILYDGEPSSVHAARTFSYLFDVLKPMETQVVAVKSTDQSLHVPDNRLIKEFIKRHYPKAEYVVLKGIPEEEIYRFLKREKGHPVVVLGAYQRGKLSRLFRPSMADYLLSHSSVPYFIAHNKA